VGVQSDVCLEYVDRMEVLAGPTGRRLWPDEVKGRLVAESFVPGVRVREVAERNALRPNCLSTWRSLAIRLMASSAMAEPCDCRVWWLSSED
jgi:transposase-like protein